MSENTFIILLNKLQIRITFKFSIFMFNKNSTVYGYIYKKKIMADTVCMCALQYIQTLFMWNLASLVIVSVGMDTIIITHIVLVIIKNPLPIL